MRGEDEVNVVRHDRARPDGEPRPLHAVGETAGDGGAGAVSFLREKFLEFGGPNGGNGGRGGDVVALCVDGLNTLIDYRYQQHFKAKTGTHGMGRNMTGAKGADVVLNAGAWSHYNIAVRDACEMLRGRLVEVHISNIHAREEFRHHSVISAVAAGVIVGLGVDGYRLALEHLAQFAGDA